jgi:hypothetical protein
MLDNVSTAQDFTFENISSYNESYDESDYNSAGEDAYREWVAEREHTYRILCGLEDEDFGGPDPREYDEPLPDSRDYVNPQKYGYTQKGKPRKRKQKNLQEILDDVDKCGTWELVPDHRDGVKFKIIKRACRHYELCPRCAADRAWELSEQFKLTYRKLGGMRVIEVSLEDAEQMVRTISEQNKDTSSGLTGNEFYSRRPLANGRCMMFIHPNLPFGQPLEPSELDALDWQAIALTPKGSKLSGSLCRVEVKKPIVVTIDDDSKTETVHIKSVGCREATREIRHEAWYEAIVETASLNPKSATAISNALETRIKHYIEALKRRGCKNIWTNAKQIKISAKTLAETDWLGPSANVLAEVAEKPISVTMVKPESDSLGLKAYSDD